jgi:hypothetical protein
LAHPECDDDKAVGMRDQRLKVVNGGIGKKLASAPRSQPSLHDGYVKRLLSGHFHASSRSWPFNDPGHYQLAN